MPTEKASRPASISVSNDPLPEKLVAVTTPATFALSAVKNLTGIWYAGWK